MTLIPHPSLPATGGGPSTTGAEHARAVRVVGGWPGRALAATVTLTVLTVVLCGAGSGTAWADELPAHGTHPASAGIAGVTLVDASTSSAREPSPGQGYWCLPVGEPDGDRAGYDPQRGGGYSASPIWIDTGSDTRDRASREDGPGLGWPGGARGLEQHRLDPSDLDLGQWGDLGGIDLGVRIGDGRLSIDGGGRQWFTGAQAAPSLGGEVGQQRCRVTTSSTQTRTNQNSARWGCVAGTRARANRSGYGTPERREPGTPAPGGGRDWPIPRQDSWPATGGGETGSGQRCLVIWSAGGGIEVSVGQLALLDPVAPGGSR